VVIAHLGVGRKPLSAGLVAGLLLAGCNPAPQIYKRSQLLMGTTVEITVVSEDESKANEAISSAFREIKRIENLLTTYQKKSQVSQVNRAAGTRPVKVSPEVITLVKEALHISELTEGSFNIALGPALALWKITGIPKIPDAAELEKVRPLIRDSEIKIDESDHTIFLSRKDMRLDTGGIGKGYAADQAEKILKQHGIRNAIISVAGDLKVFGRKPDGTPWHIAIKHPRRGTPPLGEIDLADEAISTSGDYERFFIKDGRRFHHIIDPVTLFPADRSQSVTIIAKKAILTDALATGVFIMGAQKGIALLEKLPGVEGVIVDAEGRISMTSGLKLRLKLFE